MPKKQSQANLTAEEQELKAILKQFKEAVEEKGLTESKKITGINFFSATKMLSLETKHSAFFAWLLDPSNEHCLQNTVLKKMLERLFDYNVISNTSHPENPVILRGAGIADRDVLLALADTLDVYVKVEQKTNKNKRIDLLIDIPDTQTVIVIENKINSTTHDNQLKEYEEYIDIDLDYSSYKHKIFIYLTKFGEDPYDTNGNNKGAPNKRWCRLGYGEIIRIMEELISEINKGNYNISSGEKKNLKTILEHYKIMVNTSILKTSAVSRKNCSDLLALAGIRNALDILNTYLSLPSPDEIVEYVCEKLGATSGDGSKHYFYTKEMKEYFDKNGKKGDDFELKKFRCVCQESGESIVIWVELSAEKNKNGNYTYTPTQEKLIQDMKNNSEKIKQQTSLCRVIQSFVLVRANERGLKWDELKPFIDMRIDGDPLLKNDPKKKDNPSVKGFKKILDEFTDKYLR